MSEIDKIKNVSGEYRDEFLDRISCSIAKRVEKTVIRKFYLGKLAVILLIIFIAYSAGIWFAIYRHSKEQARQLSVYRNTVISLVNNLENLREENIAQIRLTSNALDNVFKTIEEFSRTINGSGIQLNSDVGTTVETPFDGLIEDSLDATINPDR